MLRILVSVVLIGFGILGSVAFAQDYSFDVTNGNSVHKVQVPVSQSVNVNLNQAVGNISVADPAIADLQPITDRSLYIIGKALGRTTITLYSKDQQPLGLIEVEVGVDVGDIRRAIKDVAPDADIKVTTVNGRVRLSGQVSDARTMVKILDVVKEYGSDSLINAITLKSGQQVNLEVHILEANRSVARELGINWQLASKPASGPVTGNIGNGGSVTTQDSFGQLVARIIDNGTGGLNLNLLINAMESKGLVRTLAEPNLTTLSGEEASFLAGGEYPIRVISDGNVTLQYKNVGVKLRFTPIVLDDHRIQIHLTPEVSQFTGYTPQNDPIFTTRNLDATVELRDGQSFSLAGLLQSTNNRSQNQLPWLGQVPVLGALFRSSQYQKQETELVVLVTPHLVQPSTPGQQLATPLDQSKGSDDIEFFLLGQLEVTKDMIRKFETGAGVAGPFGHIMTLSKDKMIYAKQ